jgi:hypothetical protein
VKPVWEGASAPDPRKQHSRGPKAPPTDPAPVEARRHAVAKAIESLGR